MIYGGLYDIKRYKEKRKTYKIQKLTYIADFQVLIKGFNRNSLMHRNKYM